MATLAGWFALPAHRFIAAGSLLTVYLAFDLAARALGRRTISPHPPRWVHPLVFVSVGAFYALIGPAGRPLAGGVGNLAGAALVLVAGALRFHRDLRFPELAGRGLLYLALPLAVGVPWGWLVLSVPACAASVYVCHRAERLAESGLPARSAGPAARYRMVPGIW